jgi:hypothetical protein
MNEPRYKPELEFEALRNELLQGKRYVFERPILIITVSIAFIQFIDRQFAVYFPIIIIGLLSFNLWFTVNRMGSIARIVAYIQLILEDKSSKWFGWETSLRHYRKWSKLNKNAADKIKIDDESVYDNLGYYPTIYYLHIIVTIVVFLVLTIYTVYHPESKNIIINIITLAILILFIIYAIRKSPKKIKPQIEKNRQIWKMVFNDWPTLTK